MADISPLLEDSLMCLFVRTMTAAESRTLTRWLRDGKSVVRMRRAQVLAFSAQVGALTRDEEGIVVALHEWSPSSVRTAATAS